MSTASLTPDQPRYPQVHVQLSGTDGNVFAIIGRVAAALRREVGDDAAGEFTTAAVNCHSYDHVLRLAMATVTVS